MFFNLFQKEEKKSQLLNDVYAKIKSYYKFDEITEERKAILNELIEKYNYLPYPHIKALEELSPAEVLFVLEKKLEHEGVFKSDSFEFENS